MSDRKIIDSIRQITGSHLSDKVYMASCEVVSVDLSKRTCRCLLIEGKTQNEITASLMAEIDDGVLLEPVIGSTVKAIFSEYSKPFICQWSEIENIYIVAKTNIEFNGGQLGGMVKVQDLLSSLNRIENKVNDLISKFNAHTHILTLTSGTGTAAPTSDPETSVAQTQRSDIENTNITQ